MYPAPNNCGGDHNSNKIRHLSRDVLVASIEKFPNLETIIPFGEQPSLFGEKYLLPKLEEEQHKNLLSRFQPVFRKGNVAFF